MSQLDQHRFIFVLSCVILAAFAPRVLADDDDNVIDLLEENGTYYPDGVLDKQAQPIQDFFSPYYDFKQFVYDEYGLDFGFSWAVLFNQGTQDGPKNNILVSNFESFGLWTLVDDETFGKGEAGWLFRIRNELLNTTNTEFRDSAGIALNPNDSTTPDDGTLISLRQLWWRQQMLEERLTVIVGRIDQDSYFDDSTYAGSDKQLFFTEALATNPARHFPTVGLGFNIKYQFNELFQAGFGLGDAVGDAEGQTFDTFSEGRYFYAGQIVLTPDFTDLGLGPGTYRGAVHYRDSSSARPAGWSMALSFDQQINDNLGAFFRFGTSEAKLGRIHTVTSTGVMFLQPFGRYSDRWGIGAFWADPSAGGRDTWGGETFYRLQVTEQSAVSAGVAMFFATAEADVLAVFNLRYRLVF